MRLKIIIKYDGKYSVIDYSIKIISPINLFILS
jgi:hypothetical protein